MAAKGVGNRLSALFLLVLLVISIGMMQVEMAEARTCKTPSGKFKGYCVSSTNCKNVCRTEGFPSGSCDFHVDFQAAAAISMRFPSGSCDFHVDSQAGAAISMSISKRELRFPCDFQAGAAIFCLYCSLSALVNLLFYYSTCSFFCIFAVEMFADMNEYAGMMQVEMAEARTCKTPSGKFKGYCVSSTNCKNVCRTEGFPSGSCDFHVAGRKCYCYKPCP